MYWSLSLLCIPVGKPEGITQKFQLQPSADVLAVLNTTVIPNGPPISVPPANVEWSKIFQQLRGNRFVIDRSNLIKLLIDTHMSDNDVFYCTAFNQSVVSRGANVSYKGMYCIFLYGASIICV